MENNVPVPPSGPDTEKLKPKTCVLLQQWCRPGDGNYLNTWEICTAVSEVVRGGAEAVDGPSEFAHSGKYT